MSAHPEALTWQPSPCLHLTARAPQVYHDLIPVICQLLGGDRRAITRAVLAGARSLRVLRDQAVHARCAADPISVADLTCVCRPGSAVPLAMFLAFNAALLSVPGPPGDPLAHLVAQGAPMLRAGITVFSLLAIFTSFAGTSIGRPHRAYRASRCA